MILTLYYMAATWIQSWKLRSIYAMINRNFLEKSSFVFYNLKATNTNDDITFTSPSSELCSNYDKARIVDLIWHNNNQRGCTIQPVQQLQIEHWISFSDLLNFLPFHFDSTMKVNLNDDNIINLLLEFDVVRSNTNSNSPPGNEINIESFGELIAWKYDSHLSLLLKSDLKHFCELVTVVFLQNQNFGNDGFELIRIESVELQGLPQPIDQLKNYSRKLIIKRSDSICWEKHLDVLKNMSTLAYQANAYEVKQKLADGSLVGAASVKPDLIASDTIEKTLLHELPDELDEDSNNETKELISPLPCTSGATTAQVVAVHEKLERKKSPIRINFTESKVVVKPESNQVKMETPEIKLTIQVDTDNVDKPKPIITQTENTSITTNSNVTSSTTEPPKNLPDEIVQEPSITSTESQQTPVQSGGNTPETPTIKIPPPPSSSSSSARPKLKRTKRNFKSSKPPNILVYSESSATRDNVITTLKSVIEDDKYTIYALTQQHMDTNVWLDNATLLVVCGNVAPSIGKVLLDFFLKGGRMLCLCSDLLHVVLPNYRTAEVRENELVRFSYNKWKNVKMMHHIFCYQPSPVKKHFSHDSDEVYTVPSNNTNQSMMMCPRSIDVRDLQGVVHSLEVKVLGTEDTWNTPSLMLANNDKSGGKAVFSQVHLETEPNQFEIDDTKLSVLQENETARLEILADILKSCLNISAEVQNLVQSTNFASGYFLGKHDAKFDLLNKLNLKDNLIDNGKLKLRFIGKNENVPKASANFLPIMLHSCPDNFSTIDYFDNLQTEDIGRLVIYVPIITSSMDIISNLNLAHGTVVIPRRQTQGTGRNQNQWLSPEGCLMFSLQLHVPLMSALGSRISLVQHLVATAVVRAIVNLDGCKNLDIGLKWPNDIYANGTTKIGGLVITSQIDGQTAICNIGCGLNFSNSNPTVCLFDLIREYNLSKHENILFPTYEKVLANIFTEIESLYRQVQADGIDTLYECYYQVWINEDADIVIVDRRGHQKPVRIIGIDEYGYLSVQNENGKKIESVHPDGNSFDMLHGLIVPK